MISPGDTPFSLYRYEPLKVLHYVVYGENSSQARLLDKIREEMILGYMDSGHPHMFPKKSYKQNSLGKLFYRGLKLPLPLPVP